MKNKIAVLLMEAGVSYNKQKLHKVGYFRELLATNQDIDEGLKPLLRLCRETVVRLGKTESALVQSLERDSLLLERVEQLMTSCGWPDHRVDLGAGSWRRAAIFFDQEGHQLLRTVWCGEKFGQYHDAHATVETTQQTSADGSG